MTTESEHEPKPVPSKNPPALSISVPPPRSQRVVTYVLVAILVAALVLALCGVVAYWMRAQ